jgi:hypothetical protein
MLKLFLMLAALAQPPPPVLITALAARTEARKIGPPPRRSRGNTQPVPAQHRKRHENRAELGPRMDFGH